MKTVKNKIILSLAALLALGAFSTLSAAKPVKEPVVKPANEWYVSTRVSVSAEPKNHEGTNPAVFGKLDVSADGYDSHDIRTYSSAVVLLPAAVVFIQDDWDENSGEYHSNYHDTKGAEKDSWNMAVFSSVPDAEVTLTWDGLYELTEKEGVGYNEKKVLNSPTLENLYLLDTVTGEETPAVTDGKLNTYSFTMGADESSRIFAWKQGTAETVSVAALESMAESIEVKEKKEKVKKVKEEKERATAIKAMKPEHRKFGLAPE